MKLKPMLAVFAAAAALVPASARADLAVTTGDVNLRAGPDVSYPRVAVLARGVTVDVVGCLDGWQWCDVIVGSNRGFVAASFLAHGYGGGYAGAPVVIAQGGPALGIPLIAFSIGNYWGSYYRDRPWWRERERWYAHRVAPAPVWRQPPGYAWGHDRGRGNEWQRERRAWQGSRGNEWRDDRGRGNDWNAGRGNDGSGHRGTANERGPGRDRNGHAAGPIPGPYTRSEGGRYETFDGHRPNDQAHPNEQQ